MNLLARIAQWLGIKSRRQSAAPLVGLPAIPQCPAWTAHDRDWWLSVLSHERGQKLIARIRAVEYRLAVTNAKDIFHTQHSAGVVSGYGQAIESILSLASACEKEPGYDGDKDPRTEGEREIDEYAARISP